MNRDRVNDVYSRVSGAVAHQERTRKRVHWMCRQVQGQDVLDIGCSQGITSILLGREGINVVGIDHELEAIEDAKKALAEEDPSVQTRVRFEYGEATELPFPDARFDTVLLGEIVEHLVFPERVLSEVRRVLKPDGVVVITIPYGIHEFHDHKDPIYIQDLRTLLGAFFSFQRVELLDFYLMVVVSPNPTERPDLDNLLLRVAEQRLRDVDRNLAQARPSIANLDAPLDASQEKLNQMKVAIAEVTRQRDATQEKLNQMKVAIAEVTRQRDATGKEIRELRSSRRWRFASALANAFRSPRRLFFLPVSLTRAVRRRPRSERKQHRVARPLGRPTRVSGFPTPLGPKDKPLQPAVIFFAINGAGLGHLTRCLAIARHLRDFTPVFVTTCRRAHVLDQFGISYHYIPSFQDLQSKKFAARYSDWDRMLYRAMRELYNLYRPATLVSDGIKIYSGLVKAWHEVPEIGRVGIRRAYRLDGREEAVLKQDHDFNRILIPHCEGEEVVPTPAGIPVKWVGPLVVVGRDEALSREKAREMLGIPQDKLCLLLQLGAGVLGEGKLIEQMLIEEFTGRGIHIVVASYDPPPEERRYQDLTVVHRYPMALYSRAFDLAVAAAGYNTFTELLHHGVPTVFVPNPDTKADDQVMRVTRAAEAGAALIASAHDQEYLVKTVATALEDDILRGRLSRAATNFIPQDESENAARMISEFALQILHGNQASS